MQEPAEDTQQDQVAALTPRPGHDLVVIGASAGGIEPLTEIVSLLPEDLPAAVLIVVHLAPESRSSLPAMLSRKSALPIAQLDDGAPIEPGRLYISVPDRHLLVGDGRIRVTRGPRENGQRPAIDPLFRTAARAYGRRVVAVVLSGNLGDGTLGLKSVQERGGVTIVQDPDDALYPSMPQHAIDYDEPDHVLPAAEIAAQITHYARQPVSRGGSSSPPADSYENGEIAAISCPACGGPIWEIRKDDTPRYLCRTGHSYTAESLLANQAEGLESALWTAIRVLQERADLAVRLAERLERRGADLSARRFRANAADAQQHEQTLQRVVENIDTLVDTIQIDTRERISEATQARAS